MTMTLLLLLRAGKRRRRRAVGGIRAKTRTRKRMKGWWKYDLSRRKHKAVLQKYIIAMTTTDDCH